LTRAERGAQIARLRATGLLLRQIAELLEMPFSTVSNYARDPDGSIAKARKAGYGGKCEVCGKRTDGSNGKAKAPKLCAECYPLSTLVPCPSYPAYQRGCRCDGCRKAMREYQDVILARVVAEGRVPHGTEGGYRNYGCRCRPCTDAAYESYKIRGRRLLELGRAPHGTYKAYAYGCRCDQCRAASSDYDRARKARLRSAS
jgi:predicted transcriptional regulator